MLGKTPGKMLQHQIRRVLEKRNLQELTSQVRKTEFPAMLRPMQPRKMKPAGVQMKAHRCWNCSQLTKTAQV